MYVHMNQAMVMLTVRKSTESFSVKLFCIQISHNQTCTKNRENKDSETAMYFKPRGIALYTNREEITQTPRLRTFSLGKDPRNRCSDQTFKSRNYHSLTLDRLPQYRSDLWRRRKENRKRKLVTERIASITLLFSPLFIRQLLRKRP